MVASTPHTGTPTEKGPSFRSPTGLSVVTSAQTLKAQCPRRHPSKSLWSFEVYSTDKVVGVRFDSDSYAVFVAESVPRTESDQIFEELHPSDR